MHKRAELFLRDWALQNVGQGNSLQLSDPETDDLVQRMLRAARNVGIGEAALRDETVLRSLIIRVRGLANGDHLALLPLGLRRRS